MIGTPSFWAVRFRRSALAFWACALITALDAVPAAAEKPLDCSRYDLHEVNPGSSVLDPSLYLRLSLEGQPILDPCWPGPTAAAPPTSTSAASSTPLPAAPPPEVCEDGRDPMKSRYRVLPAHGALKIDFDRDAMRCLWDHDTRAQLAVLAEVSDKDGKTRKVEIEGYSKVGEELQVVALDLTAARKMLDQLYQASRFAHRILGFNLAAELAGKQAEAAAMRDELDALVVFARAIERELRGIYASTHLIAFDTAELQAVTDSVVAARERLERARRSDEAERDARLRDFYAALDAETAGLTAWLDDLQSAATAQYLDVLAGLAARDPKIVSAVAKDISALLASVDPVKSTPAQLDAALRELVANAKKVLEIENDLYHRVKSHRLHAAITARPQYERHAPKDVQPDSLSSPSEVVAGATKDCLAELREGDLERRVGDLRKAARTQSVENSGGPDDAAANKVFAQLFSSDCGIGPRPLLVRSRDLEGELASHRTLLVTALKRLRADDPETEAMARRFDAQVDELFREYRELQRELIGLEADIVDLQLGLCAEEEVVKAKTADLHKSADALRAFLLVEVIDALVARVPSAQLDLGGLGLAREERFDLHVSLVPPAPGQKLARQHTYPFEIHPRGTNAPFPVRLTDTWAFAKADGGGDYDVRPGASAMWNFYGNGRRAGSWWRTVAPGLGVTANFLDFAGDDGEGSDGEGVDGEGGDGEGDDESIEIGLGVTFSLFDNLVSYTYGWNLMAEKDGEREYHVIGFSVLEAVDKFRKAVQ